MTLLIMLTPTAVLVKILACHAGVIDLFCIDVLQFMQAATRTAIAEGFPFLLRHLSKRFFFPEAHVSVLVAFG